MKNLGIVGIVGLTLSFVACSLENETHVGAGSVAGTSGSSSSSSSSGTGGSEDTCVPDGVDPYSCGCVGHAGSSPEEWDKTCSLFGPSWATGWECHFPESFKTKDCVQFIEKDEEHPFGVWCCDLEAFGGKPL